MNPLSDSPFSQPQRQQFADIIRFGTYFYPADRHYYSGCIVQCDRCNRTNLRASIGYRDVDLCLACASQVESRMLPVNPPPIITGVTNTNSPFIGTPRNIRHITTCEMDEEENEEGDAMYDLTL